MPSLVTAEAYVTLSRSLQFSPCAYKPSGRPSSFKLEDELYTTQMPSQYKLTDRRRAVYTFFTAFCIYLREEVLRSRGFVGSLVVWFVLFTLVVIPRKVQV